VRVAGALVVVVACVALAACGGSGSGTGGVEVPKAVGLDLVAGTKAIRDAGLCWEIGSAPGGGTPIVLQAPSAGSHVEPRSPVRLYLGQDYPAHPMVFTGPQAPGCPAFTLAVLR
jgi:beta-lactam-binding protein with PASTA domain